MPRVRFDGPGRLVVFGHELRHHEVADMSEAQAAELEAHPHVNVTVLGVRRLGGPLATRAAETKATTQED
jgi:hypothetical protein